MDVEVSVKKKNVFSARSLKAGLESRPLPRIGGKPHRAADDDGVFRVADLRRSFFDCVPRAVQRAVVDGNEFGADAVGCEEGGRVFEVFADGGREVEYGHHHREAAAADRFAGQGPFLFELRHISAKSQAPPAAKAVRGRGASMRDAWQRALSECVRCSPP